MTREEAIKMIKAKLECMTRDVSGKDSDCNMRRCDECNLNYDQGNMGEQIEWLKMSIKALDQELIKDEVILTKKEYGELVSSEFDNGYAKGFREALEQEPRWIPISERLPEKNGEYLITGRQGAVNKRRYHDGHWYGNWSVLAWMPLPKPYEPQESEE